MMPDSSQNIFITYKFKKYALGGDVYERMVVEGLSGSFDVLPHAIVGGRGSLKSAIFSPVLGWKLACATAAAARRCPVGIFSADAFLFPFRFSRTIVGIVHHIGASSNPLFGALENKILARLKNADRVVVVSKYWLEYLTQLGFNNLELIYNGFAIPEYQLPRDSIEDFEARYGLTGKPIVYLGNSGVLKGFQRAHAALQGLDAHFVCSGRAADSTDGIRTLRLDRMDYLRLLAASKVVVTMSEFDEGWCRTAHEGMLSRTPVIGSGRGGMRELLAGGHQVITEDSRELRQAVMSYLNDPQKRVATAEAGYAYASSFSFEKFQSAWRTSIDNLIEKSKSRNAVPFAVPAHS